MLKNNLKIFQIVIKREIFNKKLQNIYNYKKTTINGSFFEVSKILGKDHKFHKQRVFCFWLDALK